MDEKETLKPPLTIPTLWPFWSDLLQITVNWCHPNHGRFLWNVGHFAHAWCLLSCQFLWHLGTMEMDWHCREVGANCQGKWRRQWLVSTRKPQFKRYQVTWRCDIGMVFGNCWLGAIASPEIPELESIARPDWHLDNLFFVVLGSILPSLEFMVDKIGVSTGSPNSRLCVFEDYDRGLPICNIAWKEWQIFW